MEGEDKLKSLLKLVIESFINRGEPIGSKFLNSMEKNYYAPSTLRKYLNILEKDGFLYQPYHSAWRIPTVKAFSNYIETLLRDDEYSLKRIDIHLDTARKSLRDIVEMLGGYVDGVVVGFLRNDEYYFLGINNLFRVSSAADYDTIVNLVEFIEEKKIVDLLNDKLIKAQNVYYEFVQYEEMIISAMYVKITVNWYDGILSILGPIRMDYKKNIGVLQEFIRNYEEN